MIPALALAAAAFAAPPPRPVVYAWFPREFGSWEMKAIEWDALTHLCYRSVELQGDGSLKEVVDRAKIAGLVKAAHAHGVKVTVLVWGTDAKGSGEYLAKHADVAAAAIARYVRENALDGVNVDDETWEEKNATTGAPNRDLVTAFFAKLRAALAGVRPGLDLSWASPAVISGDDKFGVAWPDYAAIAKSVDHLAIMAYTLVPPTAGWTGAAEPVAGGGKVGDHPRDLTNLLDEYLGLLDYHGEKLLLGIDTSRDGTEWTAKGPGPNAPTVGAPRALPAAQAEANAGKWGRRFEPLQLAPWYAHQDGADWIQGWWQDAEAFRLRVMYARDRPLGGVALWALDGAAEPASTFAILRDVLAPPPSAPR